jgi:hypothetical protein
MEGQPAINVAITPTSSGAPPAASTSDGGSEVLHSLPGTQIFVQNGSERRLIAEGTLSHPSIPYHTILYHTTSP